MNLRNIEVSFRHYKWERQRISEDAHRRTRAWSYRKLTGIHSRFVRTMGTFVQQQVQSNCVRKQETAGGGSRVPCALHITDFKIFSGDLYQTIVAEVRYNLSTYYPTEFKMGKGGESAQQQKVRQISLEELSEHRTPEDAWMTYKGKVYDVSGWQDHPGT